MLMHAIAPTRDFTQIPNALVWDDELSDSAFRLLVRAMALGPAKARTTTVTTLAAGLSGGRITTDRARRQLTCAGLLHTTRRRGAAGHVRTESLVSNVPLSADEAERMFDEHFEQRDSGGAPGAGKRTRGTSSARASGTALPVTPGVNTSPLPSPPPPEAAPPGAELAEAERVLLELRKLDPRLMLGAREVRKLAPLAAEWLARGVSAAALRSALTSGLPSPVKSPAAIVRWRLKEKMPAEAEPSTPASAAPVSCEGCDRAFRPVNEEQRCGSCRTAAAAAHEKREPRRVDWRAMVAAVGQVGLTSQAGQTAD